MVRISVACLLVVIVPGCRSLRDSDSDFSRILNEPAPVSAPVQASFGVMGVVTSGDLSRLKFDRVRNFPTVLGATGVQSFNRLEKFSRNEDADLEDEATRIVFISALSLAAGVLNGLFNSIPESELRKGEDILAGALKVKPLEQGIEKEFVELAQSRKIFKVKSIPGPLLEQLQPPGSTSLNLPALSGQGFDSVLVVRVEEYGFTARGSGNPPLALAALVNVDVLRVADGHMLHTGPLIYRSQEHHFNHWVADDAKLFREELETARRLYAEVMLDQLFSDPSKAPVRAVRQ